MELNCDGFFNQHEIYFIGKIIFRHIVYIGRMTFMSNLDHLIPITSSKA